MIELALSAIFIALIIWIMDLIGRMSETQPRLSAVNPKMIKPDVVCTNKHTLTRRVINDGFSTPSGEDLNQQSFLSLKAKVEEKNLILLDNERLANELSLLQSQLTDSSSKLHMFQNVHDELLATTKSELENNKRVMADITEKNLRLTNEDSRLRRKIEDRDRLIASSRAELKDLQITYDQKLDKVHDLLAVTKAELQSKNEQVVELQSKNLRLMNDDSRLRRKIEDRDRLIASSRAEIEDLRICLAEQQLDKVHEDLAASTREIASKNQAISELETKNLRLAENDKQLRRKMDHTNLLLLSSRAQLKNLRTSFDEQKLDKVHDKLDAAKRELQSKNREMNVLQNKNLRLAENDSQLRRKMEETERLLLSSHAEVEELRVNLNNQTTTIEQLLDQTSSLNQEKKEAVRKLAEMEDEQKQVKPKSTADFGCGSDEVIIHPLQMEEPIPLASGAPTAPAKSPITVPAQAHPLATETLEKNSFRTTVVENKTVKVSTKQPPAVLPEYSISSSVEKEIYVDKIVVTGITNKDCGRVVGRGGSNANRIEVNYYVKLSFINGKLFITGGDAESRLAACTDVIENLPVTMECPKLDLRRNIFSKDYSLRELAIDNNVYIYRPCREYKYVTIMGTLDRCRRVYEILQNGSR